MENNQNTINPYPLIKCQNFKLGNSHYNNKVMKRCKSTAIKDLNGKQLCINCYNLKGGK